MNFSKEQIEKVKLCNSSEELLSLAKENNIEMTSEEADEYFNSLHNEGELSEDELDNVTGGCNDDEEVKKEPQEYDTHADWKPFCNNDYQRGQKNYSAYSYWNLKTCGQCKHFVGEFSSSGKCRREFA